VGRLLALYWMGGGWENVFVKGFKDRVDTISESFVEMLVMFFLSL
jgi:hypothetical protein